MTKRELLPTNYVSAKNALTTCTRVDECVKWADKALALKSYAKQMKDTALEDMAQRIRDRAVRRGGELLQRVKADHIAKKGKRLKGGRAPSNLSRKQAAQDAGLSPYQTKQMLRVAKVPTEQFEGMVERSKPATVDEIAAAGTIKKPARIKPEPYREEWSDWTDAVRHLASIPACGLEVLAMRRPDAWGDLVDECNAAMANLQSWKSTLESADVRKKAKIEAA